MKRTEKRKAEVDKLFSRMYEDWVAGRITEYNFNMLSGKYQTEQAQLDEKIGQLQAAIAAESQTVAEDVYKRQLYRSGNRINVHKSCPMSCSFSWITRISYAVSCM